MSENISSNVTAKYSEVDLSKKKNRKSRESQDQIGIANMSENISSNVTAKYSVVDMSKKKNRKSKESQDQISIANMSENISSNVIAKYSEVDLSKKKNTKPRKCQDQIRIDEVSMYEVLQREIQWPQTPSVNQPKSCLESFKSSASPLVKVGLAVTVFLVITAIVALTVSIIILFLKVSALEAAESNSSGLQNNKTIQNYCYTFDYINSKIDSFKRELTNSTSQTVFVISNYSEQNFSFLENRLYDEIAFLNYSVQTVANNFKNALLPLINYNQTCAEIAKSSKGYSSGDYILKLSTEAIRTVYCEVTSTLGGSTSGWMRIAELDVNNCPQGFNTTIHKSVNTCIRSDSSAGCTEIRYSSHNVRYRNISGAVRAIAVRALGGFRNFILNSNYLDGVSVRSNDEHVWSFAGGCDCSDNIPNKPRFVGNDYMCNSTDYLWRDKQQCGSDSTWFFRMLPPTTSDITVRVCRDHARDVKDIALTQLELYIQ